MNKAMLQTAFDSARKALSNLQFARLQAKSAGVTHNYESGWIETCITTYISQLEGELKNAKS